MCSRITLPVQSKLLLMLIRSPRSTPIVSCGCLKISFLFFATVIVFFTAGLLSLVLRARRLLGAYRIPMETGLLIPSDEWVEGSCDSMWSDYNRTVELPPANRAET